MYFKKADFRNSRIDNEVFVRIDAYSDDESKTVSFYVFNHLNDIIDQLNSDKEFIVLDNLNTQTKTFKPMVYSKDRIIRATISRIEDKSRYKNYDNVIPFPRKDLS